MKNKRCIFITLLLTLSALCGCAEARVSERSRAFALNSEPGDIITVAAADEGQILGSFTTAFDARIQGKLRNISRAAEAINNYVVQPQEIFSYNEAVGPTTKENGFELGMIFIRGRKDKGYGGGVCQVSSTLYNAAANAGMTIIERHDHSIPVKYVEPGRDAATSYGGIDFKFQNTASGPVRIDTHVDNGTVTVNIILI